MGYADIPLWLSVGFMAGGLFALAKSSDAFVDGAAALARRLGISPFVVGMVVIGFGTSAPELCVSAMSGASGHANLSLGNAYGSCVFNVFVILGVAALIRPLVCRPAAAFVAGPVLAALAGLSAWLLRDGACTRGEAVVLLAVFAAVMPLYCWLDRGAKASAVEDKADDAPVRPAAPALAEPSAEETFGVWAPVAKVVVSLGVLVGSSHFLVWGAVDFAKAMGVDDLVIGLTIVAAGTSLPELASAVASARRGEHEFVLGNIVGSNLFNTLAVVGIAVFLSPLAPGADGSPAFSPCILTRDLPAMALASLSITALGANWRRPRENGVVGRLAAVAWLLAFAAYATMMLFQELKQP